MTPDNESYDASMDLVHLQKGGMDKKSAQKSSKNPHRQLDQDNTSTQKIELPEPEHRSHAGHVVRNQARGTRAEPPPSNPHRQGRTPERHGHRQERKKKGALGDGDDGSDSDTDKNDRGKINDDGNVVKRDKHLKAKSEPHPQPAPGPSTRAPLLDEEEMERLEKFRTLKAFEERTKKVREDRKHCEYRSTRSMRYLRRQNFPALSSVYKRAFEQENIRFREYCEDALYGDLMDKRDADADDADGFENSEWHQIVLSVEESLLERCHRFDKLFYMKRLSTNIYLEAAFEEMQKQLWEQISGDDRPQQGDVSQVVSAFVRENCENDGTNNSTAPIVDNLLFRLAKDLEQTIETRLAETCLAETRVESKLPSLPICDVLSTSRPPKKSQLKQEYVEWVVSDMTDLQLNIIRGKWRRHQRKKAIQTFREELSFLSISMRQEFIPNLVEDGTVSLVLFKGTSLVTVKNVTPAELTKIGWRIDAGDQYWRYEVSEGHVFKVNMDGEVLAIVVGDGPGLSFKYTPYLQ